MFKVGDKVRIIVDQPWYADLRIGDVCKCITITESDEPAALVVFRGEKWWISPIPGESAVVHHSDLDDSVPHAIDRTEAERLCQTYELYRRAHDHQAAFELAYGIEIEGLPF